MPAKSLTYQAQLLSLIFNGTAIASLANNATTSALTSLYVSLHTASLTASSLQSTSEAAYGGYTRVAVTRASGGWTVASSASAVSCTPTSNITFPSSTSTTTETETYFAIGTAASGAGQILYWGPISPSIAVSSGVIPQLTTSSSITES